jgi:hypothetical protein
VPQRLAVPSVDETRRKHANRIAVDVALQRGGVEHAVAIKRRVGPKRGNAELRFVGTQKDVQLLETSGSATMISLAPTLETTAGADRFTHVALTAEAIVEAHCAGEAGFLAIAPPIA